MSPKEIDLAEVRKHLELNELSEANKRTIENAISQAAEKRKDQPTFYLYRGILIIVYIGYCLILVKGKKERVSSLEAAHTYINNWSNAQEEEQDPPSPRM